MDLKKIGAMWFRKSKNGNEYFSIQLDSKQKYIAFKNKNKKEDKHPDWIIYLAGQNEKQIEQKQPEFQSEETLPF